MLSKCKQAVVFMLLFANFSYAGPNLPQTNTDIQTLAQQAEQGDKKAMFDLGLYYFERADYAQSQHYFMQTAQAGMMKAPRYLGIMYERGLGVEQNFAQAAAYFQQGDQNGDITSQYHLAKLYEQGLGVERDFQRAIALYLKHEKRQDHITAPSFIALGDIYALGLSVEKNTGEAKKWYQLAVQAGSVEAKEKLAKMH